MKIAALSVALLAVSAALGLMACGPSGRADAATFHINYDAGNDKNDGLTSATAWKHAPGDPEAAGGPARAALRPGDSVLFAPNVRYRGTITVTASGTAAAPIVFASATANTAIIDGSDPVESVTPCKTSAECGGAALWKNMVRIALTSSMSPNMALFTELGPMHAAQGPEPRDAFYNDEPDDMFEADGVAMSQGRVTLPKGLAASPRIGVARLALWVKPNRVVHRPITAMEGDVAVFDPTDLQFYTDRPAKAALVGDVSVLDSAGEYVQLPDGNIVAVLPPGAKSVTVGRGRGGIRIDGGSHIVVRGLGFENMSDGGRLPPGGVAVFTTKGGSQNILIENNRFRSFVMTRGQGPIIQREVDGLVIRNNTFDTIALGSGMRLTGRRVVIQNNEMRRIGRTGVMLIGVTDGLVAGNTITDVRGVHGNGLSVYLSNQDIRVVGNTITQASQPATFRGAGGKATSDNRILFANNLFVATPDALGSLISWGGLTRGVTIRNNVLLGGKTGLRLSSRDTGVVVVNNLASGLIVAGDQPPDWRIEDNAWTALTFQQKRAAAKVRVQTLPDDLERALVAGEAPPAVCSVVLRQTLPADPALAEFAKRIGARSTCP